MKDILKKVLFVPLSIGFMSLFNLTAFAVEESVPEERIYNCEVTVVKSSSFTVTIPTTITPINNNGTGEASYNVTVKGDIAGDQKITVVPESSFTIRARGKEDLIASVTQNKRGFTCAEIAGEGCSETGSISIPGLTAGSWTGTFVMTIGMGYVLDPGLYDVDNNLLCAWETSGIDVEKDYTGRQSEETDYDKCTTSGCYVLVNNYPTAVKVVLPDTITKIGNFAFTGCTSLTSVIIPDSVTTIGMGVFYYCTSLTSVTIPDSVTSIGDGAFDGCTSLTSITIPDSVTSIGGFAFAGCTSLTSITIPESVTTISYQAFNGCTLLTSITIPDSVTSIGDGAFDSCTSLASVTYKDTDYTSQAELIAILESNGVTLGMYVFNNTHLIPGSPGQGGGGYA